MPSSFRPGGPLGRLTLSTKTDAAFGQGYGRSVQSPPLHHPRSPRIFAAPLTSLTTSHYTQGGHEAVADQRVDACDVGRCEPTGEADHGLEMIESSPAPVAYLEVPFDALSLAFVQLAVEVLGHLVDQVDAGKIVGTRPPRVRHRPLFLRSGAPDEREPRFEPDGA